MFVGKLLAAVTAAGLTLSFAPPAAADEGLGVGTQFAGTIVAQTQACVNAVTPTVPEGVQDVQPPNGVPPACTTPPVMRTQSDDDRRVGTPELVGKCTYVGVTTLNGRIQFTFGGAVGSYSTDPTRQPQATQVNCKLISPNQPAVPGSEPTYTQTTSIAAAGAVAVTVAVPPPPPLQLRPVQICVSGFGVYGPNTEGNPKFLAETCSFNAL